MLCRKFATAVMLFLCFCLSSSVYAEKSVFFLASQSYSYIQAYKINDANIAFQATAQILVGDLPGYPGWGSIANAVWPAKQLMFITYDASAHIAVVRTTNLEKICEFDTGVPVNFTLGRFGLAGIAVDTRGNGKIYVVERQSPNLYVYTWNNPNSTLVPNSNNPYNLANMSSNGALGIALDETNGRLYVSDNSKTIRYYDTNNNFSYLDSFDITVAGHDRKAEGIAIDSNSARGYLYTGSFDDTSNSHLVKTALTGSHTSTEANLPCTVNGVAVDVNTGYVYCTISNNNYRVYDSNLDLQHTETNTGILGPAGVAVGGSCQLNQHVRNITSTEDVNYTTIGDAITAADNNDVLVVYPGVYMENVDFGSSGKLITLQSTDPNDPSIVAQTAIRVNGGNAVTLPNNSTINGFAIKNIISPFIGKGVYCSGSGSPTVKNCIIRNNTNGVFCTNSSTPTIANCIIKNNLNRGISCSSAGQVMQPYKWNNLL